MRKLMFVLTMGLGLSLFGVQCTPAPAAPTSTPAVAAVTQPTPAPTKPKTLIPMRYAVANTAVSPIGANINAGEYLGYYAAEGMTFSYANVGTNPVVWAALDKGEAEIGVGVTSFQLPAVANGDRLVGINFMEYTYPFKWDWVVKPNSPITELSQLKGKKVGVGSFGTSDFPVGKQMLKLVGLDPEKDVEWIAVGAYAAAGTALDKGDIAALIHYDTGFGQIEMAGIKLRYLPRPKGLPMVGGMYLSATKDFMEKNPQLVIGFGRAVAKGTIFCLENMDACAYVYLQMYPEAAPKGKPLSEQISAVRGVFEKRATLWLPYDPSVKKLGYTLDSEWQAELQFNGVADKITDVKQFYTNKFIDEINNFDQEAIKKQAREFKIPEK